MPNMIPSYVVKLAACGTFLAVHSAVVNPGSLQVSRFKNFGPDNGIPPEPTYNKGPRPVARRHDSR